MKIPVYKGEYEAGIAEQIKSNASVSYLIQAEPAKSANNTAVYEHFDDLILPEHVKASKDDFDLFWMNSVLVSVGWNKNDDVFDPGEVWGAKATPVYKKFNFMHDENDIIGHIVASTAIDNDGKLIPDDTETVPENFHIAVSSVLWKVWENPELQARANQIIEEISEGKWFVSMECLFRNFDYALSDTDGTTRVIARNEETSFLSKHLRVYGGTGNFEDAKVGRLLRNFTFSGKGLVNNPANVNSVIFRDDFNPFKVTVALNSYETNNVETDKMSDATQLVDEFKDRAKAAEAKLEDMQRELDQKVEAAREAEKAKLEESVASLEERISSLEEETKQSAEAFEAKEKELVEAQAQIEQLQKEIDEAKAAELKASRIATLVEAGATSEQADELVEKWAGANEEQFASVVDLFKSSVVAEMDSDMKKKDDKKKMEDGKASEEDVTEDDNDDSAVAETDEGDVEEDVTGNVDASSQVEELRAATAGWLGAKVLKTTKKVEE